MPFQSSQDYKLLNAGLVGSSFVYQFTAVCSTIVAATVLLCTATKRLLIEEMSFETDSTGLAGMTNVTAITNDANGALTIFSQAITALGANKTVKGSAGATTPLVPFAIENGMTISLGRTVADGTGGGVLTVTIWGRRLDAGAKLS